MSSDIKTASSKYTPQFPTSFTTPLPPSSFSYQNMQTSLLAQQSLKFQSPPLSSRYPDLNQRLHYSPTTPFLQETNPWKFSYTPPSLPPLRLSFQVPSIQQTFSVQTSQYLSPLAKAREEEINCLSKEWCNNSLRATWKTSPSRPLWTAEDRCWIKTYQFAGEFFNTKLPCTIGATSFQYLSSLSMDPNQGVFGATTDQHNRLAVSTQSRELSSTQSNRFPWVLSLPQTNPTLNPAILPFAPTNYMYFTKGGIFFQGTLNSYEQKMLNRLNAQLTFYSTPSQTHLPHLIPRSARARQQSLPTASTDSSSRSWLREAFTASIQTMGRHIIDNPDLFDFNAPEPKGNIGGAFGGVTLGIAGFIVNSAHNFQTAMVYIGANDIDLTQQERALMMDIIASSQTSQMKEFESWMTTMLSIDKSDAVYQSFRSKTTIGLEVGSFVASGYGVIKIVNGCRKLVTLPAEIARISEALSSSAKLNRFHQAARNLSETGQNNIRVLRGWAESKRWEKLPNLQGRPEIWGVNTGERFAFRLKIKAESSLRSGLDTGSGIPRFDARLNDGLYINPFTGETGNSKIGTHIPLECQFYE